MLSKFKNLDWFFIVLLLLAGRSLYDFNFPQATVVGFLLAYKAYQDYLNNKKIKPLDQEVQRQLDEMKAIVNGVAMRNAVRPQQMETEIKRFF